MSFFQDHKFNPADVDTTDSFEPIPAGNYRVLVLSAEEKPTKSQNGVVMQVRYQVVEGKHQGRQLFHWINLQNINKVAQEIGHKELARLCLATRVEAPKSPADFCGKLIQVVVGIEEYNGKKDNKVSAIITPPATKVPNNVPQTQLEPQHPASQDDDAPAW